jgi:hypothetical protein
VEETLVRCCILDTFCFAEESGIEAWRLLVLLCRYSTTLVYEL